LESSGLIIPFKLLKLFVVEMPGVDKISYKIINGTVVRIVSHFIDELFDIFIS